VKLYLVAYNLAQALGWAYILFQLVVWHTADASSKPSATLWGFIAPAVKIFQYAAILEVLHALLGLVRTPVFTTLVQVLSRVGLVALTTAVPDVQNHWVLSMMLFSWSITEVIRYLFYTCNQYSAVPFVLGWLRYTLFIVLYPTGVAGEVGTIFNSLPFVKRTHLYSTYMPNSLNFGFDFYYALIASFALYIIGLPYLYTYMLAQRKRFLNPIRETAVRPKVQ